MKTAKPINARTTVITPAKAQKLLDSNAGNRPLSPARVARYAELMRAGRWRLNGETIIVGPKDELIDGQHRLSAVVAAGVSVPMLVARGVPTDARPTIDIGRARSLSNIVAMMDDEEQYHDKVVAWAKLAGKLLGRRTSDMTYEEFLAWRKDNAAAVDWVREHYFTAVRGPLRNASVAGALVFAYRTKPAKVQEFAVQLRDQERLKAGDPAHTLTKWFIDQDAAMRSDAVGVAKRVLSAAAAFCLGEQYTKSQESDRGLVYFAKAHGHDLGRVAPQQGGAERIANYRAKKKATNIDDTSVEE